ncbi:AAA family ATPase [uncultured Roseobacter sp.]|uniref:AAA family ATPase n=1 Tax=uncultured Roseobacter sp. TaxID=114847 RepID=UPI0026350C4D|nr:AAA family ATPase [uncultured Roseobacter sp.]
MKLALSGAHGTGKTTLVNALYEELKDSRNVEICREVPRVIGEVVGDREYFRRGNNTELRQALIFLYQVMEDHLVGSDKDILISDRTMVDHLAYTDVLFPEFSGTSEFKVISDAVQRWLATYDYILKVPIEFKVQDDGTREADLSFQASIDQKIDEFYLKFGVNPVVITGSVSDRVAQVLRLIAS